MLRGIYRVIMFLVIIVTPSLGANIDSALGRVHAPSGADGSRFTLKHLPVAIAVYPEEFLRKEYSPDVVELIVNARDANSGWLPGLALKSTLHSSYTLRYIAPFAEMHKFTPFLYEQSKRQSKFHISGGYDRGMTFHPLSEILLYGPPLSSDVRLIRLFRDVPNPDERLVALVGKLESDQISWFINHIQPFPVAMTGNSFDVRCLLRIREESRSGTGGWFVLVFESGSKLLREEQYLGAEVFPDGGSYDAMKDYVIQYLNNALKNRATVRLRYYYLRPASRQGVPYPDAVLIDGDGLVFSGLLNFTRDEGYWFLSHAVWSYLDQPALVISVHDLNLSWRRGQSELSWF